VRKPGGRRRPERPFYSRPTAWEGGRTSHLERFSRFKISDSPLIPRRPRNKTEIAKCSHIVLSFQIPTPANRGAAMLPSRTPSRLGGVRNFAVGVGSPPPMAGGKPLKLCPRLCDRTAFFSSLPPFAWGPWGRRPCSLREGCCLCDAVSPVAAPQGRRRGQQLDNIEHSRNPTIFKVFKVVVPGR
jgi:hypothetical protein